jgi:hypothetical protein
LNTILLRSAARTIVTFAIVLLYACPLTFAGDTPALPLHLSVSVDRSRTVAAIIVTISNTSDNDWIFPLGVTSAGFTRPQFQILLTMANGTAATVFYRGPDGAGGFIQGRVDPAFTVLLPGSTYTLRLPTDEYFLRHTDQLLSEVAGARTTVRVQYRGGGCPRTLDGRNTPVVRCWTEVLTSSAVTY